MTELAIRRQTSDNSEDWVDAVEKWGLHLTISTKDLMNTGEVVAYDYQFVNSNERTFIAITDEDGKVVKKCIDITLSVFMGETSVPSDQSVLATWNDFVDYISGHILEVKMKAGGIVNTYSQSDAIEPTVSYNSDGSIKYLTCGVTLKQMNSYNTFE